MASSCWSIISTSVRRFSSSLRSACVFFSASARRRSAASRSALRVSSILFCIAALAPRTKAVTRWAIARTGLAATLNAISADTSRLTVPSKLDAVGTNHGVSRTARPATAATASHQRALVRVRTVVTRDCQYDASARISLSWRAATSERSFSSAHPSFLAAVSSAVFTSSWDEATARTSSTISLLPRERSTSRSVWDSMRAISLLCRLRSAVDFASTS